MSEAAVTPEVETDEPTSSGRTLTPAEWAEIVELWELGETNLQSLSDKFGISRKGLSKGLTKRGAAKGSRAHEIASRVRSTVLKSHEDATLSAHEERKRRIDETKAQHYDWSKAIGQQVMHRLLTAQKEMRDFGSEKANIKVLKDAAAALVMVRRERYTILDADKELNENELPFLELRDLTDQEIEDLKGLDADDGILVTTETDDVIMEEGDGSA